MSIFLYNISHPADEKLLPIKGYWIETARSVVLYFFNRLILAGNAQHVKINCVAVMKWRTKSLPKHKINTTDSWLLTLTAVVLYEKPIYGT